MFVGAMGLKVLLIIGGEEMNPRLVLLGFIAGPAFISMWMANTSAAAMMIPMATGLLHNLEPKHHVERSRSLRKSLSQKSQAGRSGVHWTEEEKSRQESDEDKEHQYDVDFAKEAILKYSQAVILGVTYGVALGGMATLIGCGPNLMLPGIYSARFPDAPEVTFLLWLKFALPLVLLWLVPMWLFMCWHYCPKDSVPVIGASLNREMVASAFAELGPLSSAEIIILSEFFIIVVLWITQSFGDTPGWGALFANFPTDGTVSILGSVLLFVIPDPKRKGQMLMDWKTCKDISWSVILLIGGGFALSKGVLTSGVSTWISINLEYFEDIPYYLLILVLTILLSTITELSLNAAVATLFVPTFAELALSIDIHPLFLMIPITFASKLLHFTFNL
jgi:sodium-dependent dicarboxylate transporter 2/3/5